MTSFGHRGLALWTAAAGAAVAARMADRPRLPVGASARTAKWYSARRHSERVPTYGSNESEVQGRRSGASATTLVLLFLALATVFIFGGSRGQPVSGTSYHEGTLHHQNITRNHMIVALNMSPAARTGLP